MAPYEGIDAASLALILQIQDEDRHQILTSPLASNAATHSQNPAGSREAELSDQQHVSDLTLARSIAAAVNSDGWLVQYYADQEQIAQSDADLARRLRRGGRLPQDTSSPRPQEIDSALLDRLAALNVEKDATSDVKEETLTVSTPSEAAQPSSASQSGNATRPIRISNPFIRTKAIGVTENQNTKASKSTTDPRIVHKSASTSEPSKALAPTEATTTHKSSSTTLSASGVKSSKPTKAPTAAKHINITKSKPERNPILLAKSAMLKASTGQAFPTAAESVQVAKTRIETRPCIVCTNEVDIEHTLTAPCNDVYCNVCLDALFEHASKDETLFPPRCCQQPIPLEEAKVHLQTSTIQVFEAKVPEFSTVDRTYCHDPNCSKFILPDTIKECKATCGDCNLTTCSLCKKEAHKGLCPEDPATQSLLKLAVEEGWQRCRNCKNLVELRHGCNHMTCRCGDQFCYVCGIKWKGCKCPQWDESRLLARANRLVDRNGLLEDAERTNQVNQAVANLRARHECDHHGRWDMIRESYRCEECTDVMPNFIFECPHCHIRACLRCKNNRL